MRLRWVKRQINATFQTINHHISETIEDRHRVTMEDYQELTHRLLVGDNFNGLQALNDPEGW